MTLPENGRKLGRRSQRIKGRTILAKKYTIYILPKCAENFFNHIKFLIKVNFWGCRATNLVIAILACLGDSWDFRGIYVIFICAAACITRVCVA